MADKAEPWEVEHAAKNVAANTAYHDNDCADRRNCNCYTYRNAKRLIERNWKAKGML